MTVSDPKMEATTSSDSGIESMTSSESEVESATFSDSETESTATSDSDMEEMDLETAMMLYRRPKLPIPVVEERIPSQPIHLDIPNPEERAGFDCKVPDEILLKIIDLFVPSTGICISNDPDQDTDIRTVRALLQTSKKIKGEILRRTFRNPLNVYITNGKRCRCQTLGAGRAKNIYRAPLGKIFRRLPLHRWSEVLVRFVPDVLRTARESCILEVQHMLRTKHLKGDLQAIQARDMKCAIECITRQSKALGKIMEGRAYIKQTRANIKFRFIFDGTQGVDLLNESRAQPLWTPTAIYGPLWLWHWTTYPDKSLPPIDFPPNISVAWGGGPFGDPEPTTMDQVRQALAGYFEFYFVRSWYSPPNRRLAYPEDPNVRRGDTPIAISINSIKPGTRSEDFAWEVPWGQP